jgi:DNA-binding transcriptional ArsR family regulator
MGLSKTEEFTKTQNEIALIAKALGHPARIAILQYLSEQKSCVCGDIVEELPLSQSTVSQHLKELKKAGLIKGEIEGPSVCYCIDSKAFLKAKKLLGDLLHEVHEGCC